MTLADRIIDFIRNLAFAGTLPKGIRILNPFQESASVREISESFYRKYYSDNRPRKLILGINPGRLGAGSTGIPFTDTKRLQEDCGLSGPEFNTHEPSSVFIYKMIEAFGGPEAFYREYYINSVCPLGFVIHKEKTDRWVNYNYYDSPELFAAVREFALDKLQEQIAWGMETDEVYSLGKKNAKYLRELNKEQGLFQKVVPMDHPRYIVQYKSRQMDAYVDKYLKTLSL